MKKCLTGLLSILLILSLVSGCSKNEETTVAINKVEVKMPKPSETQILVESNSAVAINAYLVARVYLDEFLSYDISNGSIEEYESLLTTTITAFENVERLADLVSEANEIWLNEPKSDAVPTYEQISDAHQQSLFVAVFATQESPAVQWAREITEQFSKAPGGHGIRLLAKHLNTDAKRAYMQLCQAQDILNGAEYSAIADKANQAYKTAVVLKAAGSAAGFVIAVSAAPATSTLGTVISTGGATMSGVNTLLDVGTMGAILHTNGEDSWVSQAINKTQTQMAPIGQLFALGGVFTNVKNLVGKGSKFISENRNLYTDPKSVELVDDYFNLFYFTTGSAVDFVNDGSILGGTAKYTKDGLSFTLFDTLLGKEDAVDQVLSMAEIDYRVKDVKDETLVLGDLIDDVTRENILNLNSELDPQSDNYCLDEFVSQMTDIIEEFTEDGQDDVGQFANTGEDGEITGSENDPDGITGEYVLETKWNNEISSFDAKVRRDGNRMEIFFNSAQNLGSEYLEHLVGSYDAKSGTFVGSGTGHEGEDSLSISFFNTMETTLVFDVSKSPITATGSLGAKLSRVDLTLTKVRGEVGLVMDDIFGTYHFIGIENSTGEDLGVSTISKGNVNNMIVYRNLDSENDVELFYDVASGVAAAIDDNTMFKFEFMKLADGSIHAFMTVVEDGLIIGQYESKKK